MVRIQGSVLSLQNSHAYFRARQIEKLPHQRRNQRTASVSQRNCNISCISSPSIIWSKWTQISHIQLQLAPLRSGTPLISPEELAQVNADWAKWRAEWVRRKKIFHQCVSKLIAVRYISPASVWNSLGSFSGLLYLRLIDSTIDTR